MDFFVPPPDVLDVTVTTSCAFQVMGDDEIKRLDDNPEINRPGGDL